MRRDIRPPIRLGRTSDSSPRRRSPVIETGSRRQITSWVSEDSDQIIDCLAPWVDSDLPRAWKWGGYLVHRFRWRFDSVWEIC